MADSASAIEAGARRTPARRMGPAGSPAWNAILDGAESILREEGYAALNAKRIAERTGIKRQLVYYYFCDIEDLLVQLFHRIATRELDNLRAALDSPNPLRDTWHAGIETFDQILIAEVTALANRSERVRRAVIEYSQKARDIQVAAFSKAMAGRSLPTIEISPVAMAFIASWLALGVQRETTLGLTKGHAEAMAMINQLIARCEEAPDAQD